MRVALELGLEPDPDADDLEYVRLDDLASGNPRGDRPTGRDLGFEAGAVIIDPGGRPARINDALRYAVAGCLRSVPALVDGSAYTYQCFDFLGEVQLVADGDTVLVSGQYVHPVVCPRTELLEGFVAAGMQFVELMPRILPGYEPYLDTVRRELDGARDALARR
jgi:hypothetical protein